MIVCPTCGQETPEGFPRCANCGADLGVEQAAREERKVVTVLFCDLVGSTAQAEQMDPEDVRARLSHYHERVGSELERFGGTVEKFIGDAVMALFGAPTAHEDDPERAVRAALAIRDWAEEEGTLEVRLGITTGEALVSLGARPEAGEGMASGDVVNTGARLQSAAPVNGVLVDETTYRATERAIEYRETQPVEAKGKAEPVAVWEAVTPRWRFGVDIEQRGAADLVGRGEELDLLTDALSRARRERASQLVTLVGVPGIGKSRLVHELLSQVVDPDPELIYWRQGRSLPYGEGVTFWALAEMVKSHAGILETDSAEDAGAKLSASVAEVITDLEDVDWVVGHLRPLVGLGGEVELGGDRRAEVFAAWRKFFEALAERRPLVLVFEDLQWADDGLLDFVDHLVEWASGVPLLCVCTARPELLERRPDWGGGKRNATTISLSPLSETETAKLVALLIEQAVLPAEVQSELLARAGGNPLYAEEYVRMLQDRGADEMGDLPESVQGIIAARLDALPLEEKDLLQDAAVLGKVVWVGALAQVTGLARWTVEEQLHALERKEFVRREQHSSVAGETEYAFRHVLVRDVAYGQIPRARRAGKHTAAAGWIEALAAGRGDEHAELLAHHYLQALEYAKATGEDTAEFAERGRLALRDAGDRSLLLAVPRAALRFYEAALELWPAGDPERPELAFKALFARWEATLRVDLAEIGAARDALLAAGERGLAAEAELLMANVAWYQGNREAANKHIAAVEEFVRDLPASRSKTFVLTQLSRFHMLGGEAEPAIRIGREALTLARELKLPEYEAAALDNIGVARTQIGDVGGLEDLEQCIAIPRSGPEHSRGLTNLANCLSMLGDVRRANALFRESLEDALAQGWATGIRWAEGNMILSLYLEGRWDECLEFAESFIAAAEAGERHYMVAEAYATRARIRLARGEGGAAEDARAGVALARAGQDPQLVNPVLTASAYVLHALGEPGEADELIDAVTGTWAGLVERAWLAVARGTEERLRNELRFERPLTRWENAASAILADDPVRAADMLAEMGALSEEAFTRLRSGEPEQVERALEFYRSVRAARYIREAENLLATSRSA